VRQHSLAVEAQRQRRRRTVHTGMNALQLASEAGRRPRFVCGWETPRFALVQVSKQPLGVAAGLGDWAIAGVGSTRVQIPSRRMQLSRGRARAVGTETIEA
jgi:hypothetical protein